MHCSQAQEGPGDSSNANTPSHAPTPTSSVAPASVRAMDHATPGSTTSKAAPNNKKKKAVEKEEDEDSKPAKRSKISYGRG